MNKNRNGFQVMLGLIGMIKPLLGVMCIAIIMGCIGNLMAIFITILGGAAIGNLLGEATGISMKMIFVLLVPRKSVQCYQKTLYDFGKTALCECAIICTINT